LTCGRWFLLKGNTLSYYKSPRDATPLGSIPLSKILAIAEEEEQYIIEPVTSISAAAPITVTKFPTVPDVGLSRVSQTAVVAGNELWTASGGTIQIWTAEVGRASKDPFPLLFLANDRFYMTHDIKVILFSVFLADLRKTGKLLSTILAPPGNVSCMYLVEVRRL
jgi:hypothetical protein